MCHGDIYHGREPENVHGNRLPLRFPCVVYVVESSSGTDDEEFDIAEFVDELSQEGHCQLGPRYVDRLDHTKPLQLRAKRRQQVSAPRNCTDAISFE
jgi:hypothetical protein